MTDNNQPNDEYINGLPRDEWEAFLKAYGPKEGVPQDMSYYDSDQKDLTLAWRWDGFAWVPSMVVDNREGDA